MSEPAPPKARSYTRAESVAMFGWGAVGGILPTLGKIATSIGVHFELPELASFWGVVAALAIYAFIGSIIARAMGEPEVKHALIAGIAAPAILTNVINGATEGKVKLTDLFLIGNAVAQPVEPASSAQPVGPASASFRTVTLDTNTGPSRPSTGAPRTPITVKIYVTDKNGQTKEWYSGTVNSSNSIAPIPTLVAIPKGEANIILNDDLKLTVPASQDDVNVNVNVTPKSGFSDGFLWALGAQPSSKVQIKAYVSASHPKDKTDLKQD